MRAVLFSPDGTERVEGEVHFAEDHTEAPARLALGLLSRSSAAIRDHFSASA
jgi:hydroxymethylbilane synthase